MFLDLFFYLFFNDNKINVNIPNFCPPVYVDTCITYIFTLTSEKVKIYPKKLNLKVGH